MPKIEVNERLFFLLAGRTWEDAQELEKSLTTAKAELDEWDRNQPDDGSRTMKIELNDTNRPDLWTTAGLARHLRTYASGKVPVYPFFASPRKQLEAHRTVRVERSVREVRPWLSGFIARGPAITDPVLRDMIQSQEKLAWNFGRKRKAVSIGIYRTSLIEWPVRYHGVDPAATSFVPLQETRTMTLEQILEEHPKGIEYASILKGRPVHPLLSDAKGRVLSYPPIINSADLGAVQVGDSEVFIEVTGTDYPSVALAASIMACDLYDMGYSIENVRVEYEYDTPFGSTVVFPYYFQGLASTTLEDVARLLGTRLELDAVLAALTRMGICAYTEDGSVIQAAPPEYRNDFLHSVDLVEDVMIGHGLQAFEPARPSAFTIGRLSPIEHYSRKVKNILVGLGYQEMIYNYLGSGRDFAEKMQIPTSSLVKIANPMTENYEYVRNSPLPALLNTESVSGKASYPHRTFEIGKVALKDPEANYGVVTRQYLGMLISHAAADYNEIASHVAALLYFLGKEYVVRASEDPRFVPGRQVEVLVDGERRGIFGEVHPAVLEAFGITMPCAAGEFDIEAMM